MCYSLKDEALRYRLAIRPNGSFTIIFLLVNWLKALPARFSAAQKLANHIRCNRQIFLNIGCGKNRLPGWINADVRKSEVYINAKKRLPFADNTVNFINSEEMLEYFNWKEATRFFGESFRVLKKRGVLRIATPDLDYLIDLYISGDKKNDIERYAKRTWYLYRSCSEEKIPSCVFLYETIRGHGHSLMYNEKALSCLGKKTGFNGMKRCDYGKSNYEELQKVEQHHELQWLQKASLVMEFVK